jgi:enhanced entry protein LpnE
MKRLLIVAIFIMLSVGVSYAAALEDGIAAFNAKNYEKAFPLLQPEAEQGVAAAQGLLARLYANGWGTPKDRESCAQMGEACCGKGRCNWSISNGFDVQKWLWR